MMVIWMSEIAVFDINTLDLSDNSDASKNVRYQQSMSGNIPSGRTDFCLVVAPAQDNSSTSIYLYGGKSAGSIFDDTRSSVSLLYLGQSKVCRRGRVGPLLAFILSPQDRLGITIGGGKSDNITTDSDWEQKSLAVLDLSTIEWGSTYDVHAAAFQVSEAVIKEIGGG